MDEKVFALIERLESVCPSATEIEILPTRQENVQLVVVHFASTEANATSNALDATDEYAGKLKSVFEQKPGLLAAYLWEKQEIGRLHHEGILPILGAEQFSVLYCCDNKFVLYANTLGVFDTECYRYDFDYVGMNDGENCKYVGNCHSVDILIADLMFICNL